MDGRAAICDTALTLPLSYCFVLRHCSSLSISVLLIQVAIKKVVDAFADLIDAKRILREVKMLRHFKHENVIGLRDLVPPPEDEPFNDIYIVLDFMETDLHKIIYSKNELTDEHIQYFLYQILKGMKYIHSANVIHRSDRQTDRLTDRHQGNIAHSSLPECNAGFSLSFPSLLSLLSWSAEI